MGVIIKESVRSTIISYLGVVIAFVSAALIMPKLLSPKEIGLIRVVLAVSGTFAGIFSLGVSQLIFRTFNEYRDKNLNGYFTLILMISILGSLLSLPFFLYSNDELFSFDDQISEIVGSIFFTIFLYVLISARIFYISFESILRMTKNITFMSFIQNIILKGTPLIFLALYFFGLITFDYLLVLYILLFILVPIVLIVYLKKREGVMFSKLPSYNKAEKRHLFSLGIFGLMNTMAATLLLYIDTLMVNEYLRELSVGVYVTMYFFGSVVGVPNRSLRLISGVFIVESMKKNDLNKVNLLNKKSSQSLLVFTGLVFALIWGNINSIVGYLDPIYSSGVLVILFIGLSQLFDVLAGMSSEILSASKYYWLHTPITLITIVIAIILNMFLIPEYGINGAALATSISFGVLHLSRLISVVFLFKITPFNRNLIVGLLIACLVVTLSMYMPSIGNILVQVIYKSILISLTYGFLMYIFKVSIDVNNLIDKYLIDYLKKR